MEQITEASTRQRNKEWLYAIHNPIREAFLSSTKKDDFEKANFSSVKY